MPFTFSIRFYEELNDFLPVSKRKQIFNHTCFGTPTIKDVIESLGVPHTEADLILANHEPVDFLFKPKDGDYISVYPVFESIDISSVNKLRRKPLRTSKFIADVHLGRLARYLRLMGFDTRYRNNLEDDEIIEISVAEKRIVLTRDLQLLKNKRVTHGYYVRSAKPSIQAGEVIQRFDLSRKISPFNRCIECNGRIEKIEKEKIKHLLQQRTRENFNDFYQCTNCMKIYWRGSHYKEMDRWIDKILETIQKPGNNLM
jgi:uncharacterized protein with PIN domain